MLIVLNEQTGMSADKPRKEIIASSASELDDIEVGHGSIAYVIEDSTLNAFDEDSEEWVEIQTGGGGGGGGSDLPDVTSSDNGKVLTVVSGKWQKQTPATPAGGMKILKLEVQDWGNEYVLCKAYPESGTFDSNNFDTYDAIDLYPNDATIGNFEFRRFIFQGVESNNSAIFANIIQNNGIMPNAISDATSMVVLESTFTWNSSEWYWSCAHSPSN